MPKSSGIIAEIQCPFYVAIIARKIVCESIVPGAESVNTKFTINARAMSHVIWHCREKDGAGCPVYEALMRKYDK